MHVSIHPISTMLSPKQPTNQARSSYFTSWNCWYPPFQASYILPILMCNVQCTMHAALIICNCKNMYDPAALKTSPTCMTSSLCAVAFYLALSGRGQMWALSCSTLLPFHATCGCALLTAAVLPSVLCCLLSNCCQPALSCFCCLAQLSSCSCWVLLSQEGIVSTTKWWCFGVSALLWSNKLLCSIWATPNRDSSFVVEVAASCILLCMQHKAAVSFTFHLSHMTIHVQSFAFLLFDLLLLPDAFLELPKSSL